jgi:hypothetical protein
MKDGTEVDNMMKSRERSIVIARIDTNALEIMENQANVTSIVGPQPSTRRGTATRIMVKTPNLSLAT